MAPWGKYSLGLDEESINRRQTSEVYMIFMTFFVSSILLMTQFQIEGGGMVQGVTKLIMTFSTFFDLTNKICQSR